jgi:hypothetical protein
MKIDYLIHFLAGIAIGAFTSIFVDPIYGLVSSLVVGLGKELYDLKVKKTQFELVETAFTFSGGFLYWFMRAVETMFKQF